MSRKCCWRNIQETPKKLFSVPFSHSSVRWARKTANNKFILTGFFFLHCHRHSCWWENVLICQIKRKISWEWDESLHFCGQTKIWEMNGCGEDESQVSNSQMNKNSKSKNITKLLTSTHLTRKTWELLKCG